MKENYSISINLLNSVKDDFSKEKSKFNDNVNFVLSSSNYLKNCSDSTVSGMYSKIKELYLNTQKGYESISSWLDNYANDAKNIENALSNKKYNILDSSTSSVVNSVVQNSMVDVKISSDIVSELNKKSSKQTLPYIVSKNSSNNDFETLPFITSSSSAPVSSNVTLYSEKISFSNYKYDDRGYELNPTEEVIDYEELQREKEQLLESLNSLKSELEAELEEKRKLYGEQAQIMATNAPDRRNGKKNSAYLEASKKAGEYYNEMIELEESIVLIEMTAKQTQDELSLIPYAVIMSSTEFKNFVDNYKRSSSYEIVDALETGKNQYDALADYEKNGAGGTVIKLTEGEYETEIAVEDFSRYATEEEKMVYHYLVATQSVEKANEYLLKLVDNINMMKGVELANANLADIKTTIEEEENATNAIEAAWMGISNTFQSWGMGVLDGTEKFIDGFSNWFSRDKHMSADQYAAIITAQYMSEHHYGTSYQIGNVTGNMLPALAVSVVTRAGALGLAVPAEVAGLYGEVLGTTLMGLSAGGNAKAYAMQTLGASPTSALLYGFIIGSSESLLGRYLGNIPGISQEAGFTLAGILKEGLEEASQDVFAAVVESIMYGKEINLDELTDDMTNSFIMGVLMSFGSTGIETVVTMKINGQDIQISGGDIINAIDSLSKDNRGSINIAALKSLFKKSGTQVKISTDLETYSKQQLEKIYETDYTTLQRLMKECGYSDAEIVNILNTTPKEEIINNLNEKLLKNSDYRNSMEIKKEIQDEIDPSWDDAEKARSIYINLGKRVSYDIGGATSDGMYKDSKTQSDSSLNYTNWDGSNVVCTGWSQLYKESLIEAGVDPSKITIQGKVGSHQWVEVELEGGKILIADATTDSRGTSDLARVKYGDELQNFVIVDKKYSGEKIYDLDPRRDYNPKAQYKYMKSVDKKVGYIDDDYYDFDENIDNFDKMVDDNIDFGDVHVPNGMTADEFYNYIKRMKSNGLDIDYDDFKIRVKRTGDGYEGYVVLNYKGKVILYGENTGTMNFNSMEECESYCYSNGITKIK